MSVHNFAKFSEKPHEIRTMLVHGQGIYHDGLSFQNEIWGENVRFQMAMPQRCAKFTLESLEWHCH